MSSDSQRRKRQQHEFLLTFFSDEPKYDWREVNGFVLVKQWNGGSRKWEVAIFTKENFLRSRGSRGQTSLELPEKQQTCPYDGGNSKVLQEEEQSDRLPWEQGEGDNR